MEPVFEFLADHSDSVMKKVGASAEGLRGEIQKLWKGFESPAVQGELKSLEDKGVQAFHHLEIASEGVWKSLSGPEAKAAMVQIEAFAEKLIDDMPQLSAAAIKASGEVAKALNNAQKELHGQLPVDNNDSVLSAFIGDQIASGRLGGIGSSHGQNLNERIGITPAARHALEQQYQSEFHRAPPPGTPDNDLSRAVEQGAHHQRFPGQHSGDSHALSNELSQYQDLQREIAMDGPTPDRQKRLTQLSHDIATPPATPATAQGGVTIQHLTVQVQPHDTAQQIGAAVQKKIAQAQAAANAQSAIAGDMN
jgi:cytochrome c556